MPEFTSGFARSARVRAIVVLCDATEKFCFAMNERRQRLVDRDDRAADLGEADGAGDVGHEASDELVARRARLELQTSSTKPPGVARFSAVAWTRVRCAGAVASEIAPVTSAAPAPWRLK